MYLIYFQKYDVMQKAFEQTIEPNSDLWKFLPLYLSSVNKNEQTFGEKVKQQKEELWSGVWDLYSKATKNPGTVSACY